MQRYVTHRSLLPLCHRNPPPGSTGQNSADRGAVRLRGPRLYCVTRRGKGSMAGKHAGAIRVPPETKVVLRECDPGDTHGITHEEADTRMVKLAAELAEVQEHLYGAANQAVLIVLQGMDTSGKDGTIS